MVRLRKGLNLGCSVKEFIIIIIKFVNNNNNNNNISISIIINKFVNTIIINLDFIKEIKKRTIYIWKQNLENGFLLYSKRQYMEDFK